MFNKVHGPTNDEVSDKIGILKNKKLNDLCRLANIFKILKSKTAVGCSL